MLLVVGMVIEDYLCCYRGKMKLCVLLMYLRFLHPSKMVSKTEDTI